MKTAPMGCGRVVGRMWLAPCAATLQDWTLAVAAGCSGAIPK